MKGIVFNLLETAVANQYGEVAWDELLQRAGLDGAYTSLGSYSDGEIIALVDAAADMLNLTNEEVLRWFASSALPLLACEYPDFFAPHTTTRGFLLTLNSIIHPEVRKIYPGADVPDFQFDTSSQDVLLMEYSSTRKLCAFAEGLIQGASAHYGDAVQLEQTSCMHRGDRTCVFRLTFGERAPVG